jgi:pentatricopeptide repeat protein
MRRHKVAPNVVTYNTLVHSFAQTGEHKKAWSIVERMSKDGIEPDCATYTSLLSSIKPKTKGAPYGEKNNLV